MLAFRMEQEELKQGHNPNGEIRDIFSKFLAEVVKLEELVTVGRRFLICFHQALDFLRHRSIHKTSELVQSIIKANATKRVQSYVQAGCVNVCNSAQNVTKLNTSLSELQDHVAKARGIIVQLEKLMEKAGNALQVVSEMGFSEGSEQEVTSSDMEEIALSGPASVDATGCASFIAVIYNMVKQDYVMQEKIVSSLSLKSSAGELGSYCLMWSLRPFVNNDVISSKLWHT